MFSLLLIPGKHGKFQHGGVIPIVGFSGSSFSLNSVSDHRNQFFHVRDLVVLSAPSG
jgi:hypothetical protein